jgi:arginase
MYDVDRLGIGRVMEETLDYIGNRPIHMSFDIGAIDPFFAPHTGSAVTGGLTFREANFVCEALAASDHLCSMELVEVDPSQHKDIDPAQTIDVAMTLIGSAMGQRII